MKLTIFTPTYNRAYILPQLYSSLLRQEFRDFEWLIVDDGSTDGTGDLVSGWQKDDPPFPIRYYYKANEGKCQAINFALDLAQGELFFTVDSDDYLVDHALERIVRLEESLPKDGTWAGFAGNMGTSEAQTPNTLFREFWFDGTLLDRYRGVDGERSIVFYTALHRKYRYPFFPGEKFMTEAVVWNRMARDGYRMRFFNDIFCVYQYRSDGLTNSGTSLFLNNPLGYGLFLREKAEFQGSSALNMLRMWYTFTCDLFGRYTPADIAKFIQAPYLIILFFHCVHKILHLRR